MRGLLLILLLAASPVWAQPNCRSVYLPEPVADDSMEAINHYLFYATPPHYPTEPWGHLEYPINYIPPSGVASIGLMYAFGQTYTVEGWQALWWGRTADGYGNPIQWGATYVWGQSSQIYPEIKNGIRFAWYPITDRPAEHDPATFRTTINKTDTQGGIDGALSTVLQRNEGVSLGVNVLFPYPEPILTMVALHLRECS